MLYTPDFSSIEGELAESWEINEDATQYTIHLRDGVTWHDGEPFTSADAAFSILRLKAGHPRGRGTFANDPAFSCVRFSQQWRFGRESLDNRVQ